MHYKIGIKGWFFFTNYKAVKHEIQSEMYVGTATGEERLVGVPPRLIITLKNGDTVVVEDILSKTWKVNVNQYLKVAKWDSDSGRQKRIEG